MAAEGAGPARHVLQALSFRYGREHYLASKQRYVDEAQAQKRKLSRERTSYRLEYFALHPCTDCGETDPVVLEFDHLRDKVFNIGKGLVNRSWESVLAEIEKCEIVCANCHRHRTYRRRGTVRVLLTQAIREADGEARTRASSLEGSRATATPRPLEHPDDRAA